MTEPNQIQQSNIRSELTDPMTVKQWLGTLALLMIPLANIVLVFYWAFSDTTNISKKNYFRASLILGAIIFGLYIALFILIFVLAGAASILS